MELAEQTIFHSPTHGELSFAQMLEKIGQFIEHEPERESKIVIGTDSQPKNDGQIEFITAVVVHRIGRGGIYFWKRTHADRVFALRDRMYREALLSIEFANECVQRKMLDLDCGSIEIHVDVGENGPTRLMIREIVGMVTGNGFKAKTKPESYAASKVADRHT